MGHPPPCGNCKNKSNSKVNCPTQADRGLEWATRPACGNCKNKNNSKVNCPTQANRGLEWATRHPAATAKTKATARSTAPLKPTEGLNGPPALIGPCGNCKNKSNSKVNWPTQANRGHEWATRPGLSMALPRFRRAGCADAVPFRRERSRA